MPDMTRRAIRVAIAAGVLCASAAGALPGSKTPVAAALPAQLTIVGHGWGHGRGMGQYGAEGYALDGWNYQQILAHYYGGTTLTTFSPVNISVNLLELYGANSVTVSAPPGSTLVVDGAPTNLSSTTLKRSSSDQSVAASGGADLVVAGPWSDGATRTFAGSIVVKAGSPDVLNVVPLESYVAGVVPYESPASWSLAALQAQAVAARSYALAYSAGGTKPICDTTSCQVYGGVYTGWDSANSDQAASSTAYQVLDCGSDSACGAPSQVAFTEFSSSTGGYTAGGAFPAVVDAGDATPSNPNHDWSVSVATSQVEQAFPSVGALESINVTQRNGLGDLGGRVLQMQLTGSAGTLTITGDQFEWGLGLNSNWFAITNSTTAAPPTTAAPSPTSTSAALPAPTTDPGYWVVDASGGVLAFGSAPYFGSMAGTRLNKPVIATSPTSDGKGYWLLASDGGVFTFGDARFYGSTGSMVLNKPIVGMAPTADGNGYWLVASDGGIFSFGDASFYGSTGMNPPPYPIVGMARTPDGRGYWLVDSMGQVFNFGDAGFHGSLPSIGVMPAYPIVGMVPTADGNGYWLVGADGGIFSFGDAGFVGSLGGKGILNVVSVASTPDSHGYMVVTSSGVVYTFGDATSYGDPASNVRGWSGQAIGIFDAG